MSLFTLATVCSPGHSHWNSQTDLDYMQIRLSHYFAQNSCFPFSLRIKARDPRWFFRELPRLDGYFSDYCLPLLLLAHPTPARLTPWPSLRTPSTLYLFLWLAHDFLPPSPLQCSQRSLVSFGVHSKDTFSVRSSQATHLQVATFILNLSIHHLFIFLSSQLIYCIYFHLPVYHLSNEHKHFYIFIC